jgi:hypothetical protein
MLDGQPGMDQHAGMTNRLPDYGQEGDTGDENMPKPEGQEEKSPRPKEGAESADSPDVSGVKSEEQAIRAEMAQLGFVPVDPATLEKGEPLSQEDWQALYRLHRDPGSMSKEEQLRIIRLRRRYDTWYHADREVFSQTTKEIGFGNKRRN